MSRVAVFMSLLTLDLALPQHASTFNTGRKFHLDGKIIGGKEATIEEFPFMVSVRELDSEGFEYHLCGGSIISENFVVTAGHCCKDVRVDTLSARVGSTNNDDGEKHNLSRVTLHPQYYKLERVPYNDICLLKVSEPFVYNDRIKAISLPEANSEIAEETLAVTAGWGSTYSYGESEKILREVEVPIVSHSVCVSEYGENSQGANYVNDTMICAGYEQGGKDACGGDSGGPLAVSGTLAGIVSWGRGCATPKYAGVYTNVAYFRDWIQSETGV